MTRWVAFLRGINLGKRQMQMAELAACLEGSGLRSVRTILASGNAAFESDDSDTLKQRIEAAIAQRFGFTVAVVLRQHAELEAMVQLNPFGATTDDAQTKRYVLLLDTPPSPPVTLEGIPGDFDIVARTKREIFVLAHRLSNGRYGQGMDKLGRMLDKACLVTTRNWNTIIKAAGSP